MPKDKSKPAEPKAEEKKPEEIAEEAEPKAEEKPKEKGVLFWGRIRVDTSAGPVFYDDPGEVPEGAHYNLLEAEFPKIEYPKGSKKSLKIFGAKRIDDKNIIAFLILKNKPTPKAGLGKGSKMGGLLYKPEEVVEQGYMTEQELKDAAVKNIPPKWYREPHEPPPPLSMLPDSELDKLALKHNVKNFDITATRWDKIRALQAYYESR